MMKMVCIKQFLIKFCLGCLIIIPAIFFVLCLRERQEQGTTLTEFEIINSELSLTTDNVVKDYVKDKLQNSIISLSFEDCNDTLLFTYTGFGSMEDLSREFVFYRHYRILGYIERKPFNIIVLSNIQPFNHMLETTKHMIKPLDKSDFIKGIYYEPFRKSNWKESYRDPNISRHYKYYCGKIHGVVVSMDQ